jgi:hypothetical protein
VNLEIRQSWRDAIGTEFDRPYFKSLAKFVAAERQAFPLGIYPAADQVFSEANSGTFTKFGGEAPALGQGRRTNLVNVPELASENLTIDGCVGVS